MTTHIGGIAAPSRGFPSARELGHHFVQTVRRHLLIHRTRRELGNLSDLELADIGITRCDINHVAASTTDWHFERGRKGRGAAGL